MQQIQISPKQEYNKEIIQKHHEVKKVQLAGLKKKLLALA